MKVLVTGASGLVGKELIPTLEAKGHEVFRLSRRNPQNENDIQWDAYKGFSEKEFAKLEGIQTVVHLAGESIAESWTDEKKKRIKNSRVEGTKTLVSALARLENPPKVLVSASAIGFYGDRGDEVLNEDSPKGVGFLPDVGENWENEAFRAEEFGTRVVALRIGVVLSKDGGALEKMLTPFKFGVGGTVGSGEQWMSWIAIDDLIGIIHFAIENEDLKGVVNSTAPNPLKNRDFTDTLGKALSRPTILPVPSFGVKMLFGEMGERLLLEGARVIPEKLENAGYDFKFANLEDALNHILK